MKKIICYTDGGSRGNPGRAGAGAYITDSEGKVLHEASKFLGKGTNNFAEYAAVILALATLKKLYGNKTKSLDVEVRMDSELIQRQLSNVYQIKDEGLIPLFVEIHNMRVKDFPHISFKHIPREKNTEADRLANEAMDQ